MYQVGIAAHTSHQLVDARATVGEVGASSSVELISTRSTKKLVIACRTYQQIIASPAENNVVAQFP